MKNWKRCYLNFAWRDWGKQQKLKSRYLASGHKFGRTSQIQRNAN